MFTGLALAIASGILDGSTALPMHFVRRWRWESLWLVFCVFEMLVVPWIAAFAILSAPLQLYVSAPDATLITVLILGMGFGVGNLLFGLGITRVGMGLGNAVIVSVTAVTGALVPLIILHPQKLGTRDGDLLLIALAVLVAGIVLCTLAARGRKAEKPLLATVKPNLVTGLIICIVAGLFSPCVNFAFAFGQPLADAALHAGAAPVGTSLAILLPMLFGAFIVSGAYCLYLLTRNGTWADYRLAHTGSHWIAGFLMGCCNGGAFLVYGVATGFLGSMGPVVGWPIYMAMIILTSNIWGWIRGEWRGSSSGTYVRLLSGMTLTVFAIYLVSRVQ